MRIGLKVKVETLRGTLEGVPNLLRLFERHEIQATFLFSLGPDNTGRALRRIFRPGFFAKGRLASVVSYYGIRTLLNGTLLPSPDIGRRGARILREVRAAGHEVGIQSYDHVRWQDLVARRDRAWTRAELTLASEAFQRIFEEPARVHGAAGWQLNDFVPALEAELGIQYASDTRGRHPFVPVVAGATRACPQMPTTLPTLDELMNQPEIRDHELHQVLYQCSRELAPSAHVFALHAELEGMRLQPVLERLLIMWQSAGDELVSLRDIAAGLDLTRLPRHRIAWGELPGRAGRLALQGAATGEEGAR
ncbi:polysaccharide deacetylase family protein [Thiorhodovibrio frisius]|uniref:Putative xylanase/chitin deacetylase n=1 Tax=Thiorhodovibrio frisius TaxID=631362 RepID=H8YX08_9GAMM|nr:polysaccharide deacetylase family protein [Thiorhodovibrio frisius]EIC22984.1 putative xylanase/chitin deacetylase [Thiorhodovibrio frisius]WPL22749.1 putative 4-deoxy-4-formamido-L-arabinose-phosphoundecaprenol deformylase ArnD [Thiorhodovibrio frisius]